MSVSLADILAAGNRIAGLAARTPLVPSPGMTRLTGSDVLLKLDMTQPIGAFKLRGAANAILSLSPETKGVTCCSTGNHGRGVAYAARERGLRAVICMSSLVPQTKIDGILALGAEVRIAGDSQDDALVESQRLAAEEGFTEISPFDDPLVIAGQGTIGLELLQDRPDLKTILVPVSGGGLAAGIAMAAKAIRPDIRVVGISMNRGAAMHASLAAGHPVEVEEVSSLADSLGGGIGLENRLSFPLCRELLDELVLVSEEDIYRGMQTLYYEDRLIAEGASAVGIAALQAGKVELSGEPAATIITGRNVDMAAFHHIMSGGDINLGGYLVKGKRYGS
jgi:threonine dehydratase